MTPSVLTVFVLPAEKSRGMEKLQASFKKPSLIVTFVAVDTVADINIYKKEMPWYGVFYGNEYIEEKLAVALHTFFTLSKVDVFIVFKLLEQTALFFPRFYKNWVYLQDDLTPLQKGLKYEKILNGWVLENGRNDNTKFIHEYQDSS